MRLYDRTKFCRVFAKALYVHTKTRKVMHFYPFYMLLACFWAFSCVKSKHLTAQDNQLLGGLTAGLSVMLHVSPYRRQSVVLLLRFSVCKSQPRDLSMVYNLVFF